LLLPAVTGPMASPLRVTVTADVAAIIAVAVVMTIEVDVGAAALPVEVPLMETAGVAAVPKKPEGYASVMKLPIASAPPAVVVKLNVAATFAFPATRSVSPITNVPVDTCPPMTPDPTPTDTITSALVATAIPLLLPPLATPIINPESVTVTELLATTAPLDTVITIDVDVGAAPTVPDPPPLITTAGVAPEAKNPEGYVSVILPPTPSAPPTVGVNENVAAEPVFPATRSVGVMLNDVLSTR